MIRMEAVGTSKECGMTISALLEDNRREFATQMLAQEQWRRLSSLIENFDPELVILVARKMPRAIELARVCGQRILPEGVQVISDFAIDSLKPALLETKVAIVDDAVNVGSTMADAWQRARKTLGAQADIRCFTIAMREGGAGAIKKEMKMRYALDVPWNQSKYQCAATALANGFWCVNRPFEIEYPVYIVKTSADHVNRLPEMLVNLGENCIAHRLDREEAPFFGLHRFSLDIRPGRFINDKIRFYVDSLNNEIVAVPMAGSSRGQSRKERFLASMRLGSDIFSRLHIKEKIQLSEPDTEMLFGASDAAELLAISLEDLTPYQYETGWNPREGHFYQKEWPCFRHFCMPEFIWSMNSCIEAFFNALAEYTKADTGQEYGRLCRGPTFGELQLILGELYKPDSQTRSISHESLSVALDRYIDQGFIVPVLDSENRRIFRKGEPHPLSSGALAALRTIGAEVDIRKGIQDAVNDLSEKDRARFEKLLRMREDLPN